MNIHGALRRCPFTVDEHDVTDHQSPERATPLLPGRRRGRDGNVQGSGVGRPFFTRLGLLASRHQPAPHTA
jgi:hypothetical protein